MDETVNSSKPNPQPVAEPHPVQPAPPKQDYSDPSEAEPAVVASEPSAAPIATEDNTKLAEVSQELAKEETVPPVRKHNTSNSPAKIVAVLVCALLITAAVMVYNSGK